MPPPRRSPAATTRPSSDSRASSNGCVPPTARPPPPASASSRSSETPASASRGWRASSCPPVEDEASIVVANCPPYGEGTTFSPIREAFRHAGRDESVLEASSYEVFAATRNLFEELAREQPLVVVFDDVHWAEETLLDLIEHLSVR